MNLKNKPKLTQMHSTQYTHIHIGSHLSINFIYIS